MSEADSATLAAIQRVTKRCLAEIDRVCTLLDIRYVAYG
ncbi:LicD family protein, partial [Pauljensenia sp. UMB3104]|nr:LicD family protein [Pauljensenia sp. UMB3104]